MEFKWVLELTSFNTIVGHNRNYLMIDIKDLFKRSTFAEMYLPRVKTGVSSFAFPSVSEGNKKGLCLRH